MNGIINWIDEHIVDVDVLLAVGLFGGTSLLMGGLGALFVWVVLNG